MMRILRGLFAAALLISGCAALGAVQSFDFIIPKRGNAAPPAPAMCPAGSTNPQCRFEIAAAKVTLQLDNTSTGRVIVSVTRHATSGTDADQEIVTLPAGMDLTTNAADCFAAGCGSSASQLFPQEPTATLRDSVQVFKPKAFDADPYTGDDKVVLLIYLGSNANDRAGCPTASPMLADERWTVKVTTPGMPVGPNRIQGVAIQSIDSNVSRPCPASGYRAIPDNEGAQITVNSTAPLFATGRIPLDAILVLDHSGSMAATDGGTVTRLQSLKDATASFLTMWNTLRYGETSTMPPTIASPADHVGIVFFDNTIQWASGTAAARMETLPPPASTLPAPLTTLIGNVNAVNPAGSTSIGNGLIEAATVMPPAGTPSRRVMLLMTDGLQNTAKFAYAAGVPGLVMTSDDPGGTVAQTVLPQQPYKVYTVTLGNAFAAAAPINQQIADATGAYTLHAFNASANILNLYFLQLLQNFHKFATVETMRIVQDKTGSAAPFEMTLPVTTTTKRIAFALDAARGVPGLRLELVPPGGGAPIAFTPAAGATGIVNGVNLPLSAASTGAGLWKVRVVVGANAGTQVPFSLSIMGDDATINSSLAASSADPVVGGRIKLTAQVSDFGPTLKGLGSQPGAVVKAFMVTPGNNVGDVLSDSTVQPAPVTAGDTATPAERKLAALLAQNPNALALNPGEIVLHDDGMNGDDTANDGIYTAYVPADFEGHYNFVFYVEGRAASGGHFVRQQLRTVHIRSMPVPANTTTTWSAVSLDSGSKLVGTTTPRNVRNGRLGPGWANYIWFNPSNGPPVKPVDNLNGTYTATIPFTGGTPPTVSVHFLPEAIPRTDTFVPPPGALTPGNAIVPPASGRRAVWLALGSTFPSGSFSNDYRRDLAADLGVEFAVTANTAIEATLGRHQFKGRNGAPDLDVTRFGVNGKWYLPKPGFAPFVTLGAGGYAFNPGSTRFGVNAGVGVQVKIAPPWSLEARYTFHGVSGNAPNSRYSTLEAGLRYEF